jgi:hypothetical protein
LKHLFLLSLFCIPASSAVYTVSAVNLTMHAGDLVPPLIFNISSYTPPYNSLFNGQPTVSTSATSGSPAGTYTITISAGSMSTVSSLDSLSFVNGTLTIIAPDSIGAALNDNIAYPSGEFSGPMFAMINVKSNSIVNLAGDCATDDSKKLQYLLAWGRDTRSATVNVSGTAVTATSGVSFTGLVAGPAQINGITVAIASVTDGTHLTLTGSPGTITGGKMKFAPNIVNTDNATSTITASNGLTFIGLSTSGNNSIVYVAGYSYQISTITDATHIIVAPTSGSPALPTLTSEYLTAGSPSVGYGRQMLQLYFPTGCYLVSRTMVSYGNYWTLTGDGPQLSYWRLANNTPSFNVGSTKAYFFQGTSDGGNQNFREFILNMGFDVGPGNPNAGMIHWYNNNLGAMRNVQIWSEDGGCQYGLGLEGAFPGPTMMKNIAIYGCQVGIQMTGQSEYITTFEGLTTQGQTSMALSNGNNHAALRQWQSVGGVSVISATGGLSSITMIDSAMTFNGSGPATAITNGGNGSAIYLNNVSCTGFSTCAFDQGSGVPVTWTTLPSELWTGTAQSVFNSNQAAHSLGLAESETPQNPDPCTPSLCDWQQLGSDPTTWAAAIASPTSTSIYLPPGTYNSSANPVVTVPDSVNYINFNVSQFSLANTTRYITINVAGTSSTPLIIDGCMYTNCAVNHTGTRTVVLQDYGGTYQAQSGAGNLYIDDLDITGSYPNLANNAGPGPTFYSSQKIWARQLDIENGTTHGTIYPKFVCNGATMWLLGYKTEQDSPSVVETNQCQAELFGFFFYQLSQNPAPALSSPIYLTNSSLFATGFIFVNASGFGAPRWINETQGNSSYWITSPTVNLSLTMPMLYSYGGSAPFGSIFGKYIYINSGGIY